jgi:MFS family permease
MDVSSEIVHALLPLFLTATLGASVVTVGLIDGIAEATASISKVFSGYVSDRIGRRKPLILIGYGLAVATKPFFALADSAAFVLGARFADRIGKGLRGAPRDALVADVTPPEIRGRAFGLRQSLDTAGALAGPLIAIGLMLLFANDMRSVFWVALLPGLAAVAIIVFAVRDPETPPARDDRPPLRLRDAGALDRGFWMVVLLGTVFTLARFSEAFLILRADALGLPLALAPLVLVAMNLVYTIGAYPAGILSDRGRPHRLLGWGLACLIAADLLLASATGLAAVFAGIALWGAHMALSQGLLAKLVADHSPAHLRGSAFGLFNLASGIAMLAASLIAGWLWERAGAAATFLAGAGFAAAALLLVLLVSRGPAKARN